MNTNQIASRRLASKPLTSKRLIVADDNIRDTGGHFFELASLLLDGAEQLGYQGVLATNASFSESSAVPSQRTLRPTFHTRRLVHWSLGVDGHSKYRRDLLGKSVGGSGLQNAWTNSVDRLRPKRCPQKMLTQWASDLQDLITRLKVAPGDSLLINTGDDFAMLALAAAIGPLQLPPLRIDVLFHFALYDTGAADDKSRLRQIGRQIRSAASELSQHELHLHATTEQLSAQLRRTDCGTTIGTIPYPTRGCQTAPGSRGVPWKIVLAGLPRAEKGKPAISALLAAIEGSLLRSRRFRISMQMPADGWQSMVPRSVQAAYQRAASGATDQPIEVMTNNLATQDYHAWLDTADVGLFLYDAERYVARCSGVLLELLARGIPVIVPDGCWLADQIRIAGGHRSIGLIYQDRAEIPDLLEQFANHREAIRTRAAAYAPKIRQKHSGRSALLAMGIPAADQRRSVA